MGERHPWSEQAIDYCKSQLDGGSCVQYLGFSGDGTRFGVTVGSGYGPYRVSWRYLGDAKMNDENRQMADREFEAVVTALTNYLPFASGGKVRVSGSRFAEANYDGALVVGGPHAEYHYVIELEEKE